MTSSPTRRFPSQDHPTTADNVPGTAGVPTSGISTSGVPASGVSASGVSASGVSASGVSASGVPASGVPASGVGTDLTAPSAGARAHLRQAGAHGAAQSRLDALRGPHVAKRHNARTIAALTANPGCTRRAVLDAAGVDKPKLADRIGFTGDFGQSRFALARGNAFEAMLKANGGALLLETLAALSTAMSGESGRVAYTNLGADVDATLGARHTRTRELLGAVTTDPAAALIDHPLLTLDVAGQTVFLEPDLIAFQVGGRLRVVEIKSFAIVDGQADSAKVSAAATQAAVYVLAVRRLLSDLGHDPSLVSHDVVLVCPENFSLRPAAVVLDVRKQLSTLTRQLTRLASVAGLIAELPAHLSFDLALPPADLVAALAEVDARYAPECLSACELAAYCRHESAGRTSALGRPVRDALGGIESVAEVLALAAGTRTPAADQTEAATLLQAAARLRAEALGVEVPNPDAAVTP